MVKMSKFFDRLDKLSDILGGKSTPDQILEENAKLAGSPLPEPAWYSFIKRRLQLIIGLGAILFCGILFLTTRTTDYISPQGLQAVLYLAAPLIGLILLPLMLVANIQKKLNFRNSLPEEQRQIYDASIKKRLKEFIILFMAALLVTMVIVAGLLYRLR